LSTLIAGEDHLLSYEAMVMNVVYLNLLPLSISSSKFLGI
jgi:hypothetical protein